MEDESVININISISNVLCTSGNLALLCVFDGHGGNLCSKYCSSYIEKKISQKKN